MGEFYADIYFSTDCGLVTRNYVCEICNNDLQYKPVKVIVWDVGMNISFL